ncbi:MAG: hypothetical protein HYS32_00305 [Candidatus Woesearchaeota archaeon]|nr:MAG: hypothetical protein HYS32_00305 [Candidatus Woesearchaeota archaeon]
MKTNVKRRLGFYLLLALGIASAGGIWLYSGSDYHRNRVFKSGFRELMEVFEDIPSSHLRDVLSGSVDSLEILPEYGYNALGGDKGPTTYEVTATIGGRTVHCDFNGAEDVRSSTVDITGAGEHVTVRFLPGTSNNRSVSYRVSAGGSRVFEEEGEEGVRDFEKTLEGLVVE